LLLRDGPVTSSHARYSKTWHAKCSSDARPRVWVTAVSVAAAKRPVCGIMLVASWLPSKARQTFVAKPGTTEGLSSRIVADRVTQPFRVPASLRQAGGG